MPKQAADLLVKSFLEVVDEEKMSSSLPQIFQELEDEAKKHNDEAIVWTRVELTSLLLNKIQTVLEKKTGKKVKIKNLLDEKILGGFKIELGEWVYDATLRKNFENINKLLA